MLWIWLFGFELDVVGNEVNNVVKVVEVCY